MKMERREETIDSIIHLLNKFYESFKQKREKTGQLYKNKHDRSIGEQLGLIYTILEIIDETKPQYEKYNVVSEDGDSIYALPIDKVTGGQIYVSEDKIREIVQDELTKHFRNNNKEVEL